MHPTRAPRLRASASNRLRRSTSAAGCSCPSPLNCELPHTNYFCYWCLNPSALGFAISRSSALAHTSRCWHSPTNLFFSNTRGSCRRAAIRSLKDLGEVGGDVRKYNLLWPLLLCVCAKSLILSQCTGEKEFEESAFRIMNTHELNCRKPHQYNIYECRYCNCRQFAAIRINFYLSFYY